MMLDQYITILKGIQKQAGKRPVRVVRDGDLGFQDAPAPKVRTIELDDLASSEFMAGVSPGQVVVEV